MKIEVCGLEEKHMSLLDEFSCVETEDELRMYNAKTRKRIKRLSKEMDDFLKYEAYVDQEKGLSRTHLLVVKNEDKKEKIAAYISLCNDSVKLDVAEKEDLGYAYKFVPSMKIARLAVSTEFKHLGIGKYMIDFAVLKGWEIRAVSGLALINIDCFKHRQSYYEDIGFVSNSLQQYENSSHLPINMRIVLDEYLENLIQ